MVEKVKWEGLFVGHDFVVRFETYVPGLRGRKGRRIEATLKKQIFEVVGRWPTTIIFAPTLPGRPLIEGEISLKSREPFNPVIQN